MKKQHWLLSLVCLLISFITKELIGQIQVTANNLPIYQDGKLYVKIKLQSSVIVVSKDSITNDTGDSIKTVFARYNVTQTEQPFTILNDINLNKTYRLTFSDIINVENFITDLQQISAVEYSEKVPAIYTTAVPNDPMQPYHLPLVNSNAASNIHISSGNAIVAIVDDAVLTTHQDLAANVGILNRDVADLDNNPNPPLTGPTAVFNGGNFSHGTHVAGIAGAVTNNGIGVASIGWNNRLMCIKTRNDNDPSGALPFVYDGIAWAAANGAHVINLSVGGFAASQTDYNVIVAAKNLNVVLVSSAGNNYTSIPSYPAAYGEGLTSQTWELIDKRLVVAVAALDANSDISYWGTNGFGLPSGSNFGSWVDISAYGTGILSTIASSSFGAAVNNLYGNKDGTSMACPIVAGIAGIMRSYNMSKTADEIIDCLLYTANPDIYDPLLHPNNVIGNLGTGRVDADAALRCLGVPCGTSPVAIIAPSSLFMCPGGNVILSANSGVSYLWSTGATTQNINVNSPGNYWVTVTFAGGCTSTANITIQPASTQAHIYFTENSGAHANDGILCGTNFLSIATDYGLSYQWNAFGATSQGVSNINAGIITVPFTWNVSVTVTGLGGCPGVVSTANATAYWIPLPTVVASANPTTVNACSPVVLSATGANTYTWAPGSIVGSPITVLPNATTTYVVTGTDTFGCTNTSSVLVNVIGTGLTSVVTTATPNNPISGNPVTVNAIVSPPGNYTYVWSPNIGNTPSVTFVPTDNAVYTCNVTDQCGNTMSSSVCISLESNLCASTSNVTLNNTSFNSSITYNNQIITIIGNINILNGTLTFKNCTLKMGTNSKFIVSPVSTIAMVSSKVFSCEGMWFGIEAQSNGSSSATVNLKGTSIEDAYNAIFADNSGVNVNNNITVSNCTLNKNYIDISINNASSTSGYPLVVQSSNLTSNASTTSPGNSLKCSGYYPVGASVVKSRSFAGLQALSAGVINFTNNNFSSNFNQVSNKDYGLAFKKTGANVYYVQFKDMVGTTSLVVMVGSLPPLPVGVAILSTNSRNLNAMPLSGPVTNALLFKNVGYGIITNKTSIVDVENAEFKNPTQYSTSSFGTTLTGIGQQAIYAIDADGLLRINSNTITTTYNAITASYSIAPKAAGLFSISQNTISAGTGTLNTAIDIASVLSAPFTGIIGNQIIAANQITNASTAGVRMISVAGSSGLRVSGNSITLKNLTTGTRDGILLNGANNNVMIDNNTIDGNLTGGVASYNLAQSGIRSVNSPGCFIQCNNITHTGKGVVYSGNNATGVGGTGTEFFGNNLNAPIKQGLVINNGGMIGTQGNSSGASANVWNGFNASNSDQTLVGGPFPFSPLSNAINSVLFVHNNANERPTDNVAALPTLPINSYQTSAYLPIAAGGNITGCPIALTTGAKVILTPTLDVTQRNADYSTYITSVITPTSNAAPQAKWMLKQHMHKAIRQTQIGNNATVANFYVAEQMGDAAKYYEVDSLLGQGDTILAKAKNNVAPVNNDIEQTHNDFNKLYLSGITNATDYAALETIANLCAYKYGNAVYQARALVNIVTYGNRDFEEDCEKGESSRIGKFTEEDNSVSVTENIQAHLFPNPNNGNFTLSYDLKQIREANIHIIDITGKVVYTDTIDDLNNLIQINTQDLHSGMYFIQLMNKNTLLWTDKVMISK